VKPVRILLADDHALVRAGIRALLGGIEGVQIESETVHGRDAVAQAHALRPDLVIMDISMKEFNGIDATAQITSGMEPTRVLILSMHTAEEFVRRALKAGASGYLFKDSAPLELKLAIETIARGGVYLSSRILRDRVSAALHHGAEESGSPLDSLTARQREVLQMFAEGRSTKEIAAALAVSVKTVETHRAALMERLGIHELAGLVVFAARNNLISLEPPSV